MADEPIFELSLRGAPRELARLPREVRDVLRLCDGKRARSAIRAGSPLAAEQTDRVLERLLALGLIVNRNAAPPPPPVVHFTVEEEQFFASSIDHLVGD